MSYLEQELHQVLAKLFAFMNAKITSSTNLNPTDFEFLAQLRVYMNRVPKNEPKEQKNHSNLQTRLRTFLRKAKPWEKMNTPIPDVFVIKVPIKKNKRIPIY